MNMVRSLLAGIEPTLAKLSVDLTRFPRSLSRLIVQYCRNLCQLSLGEYLTVRDRDILPALLRICGPSLETLEVEFKLSERHIASIEKHCGNLQRLKLEEPKEASLNGIWRSREGRLRDLEQ